MYTQALDAQSAESAAPLDEGALEQRFLARVDAEEKIEPKDWMPDRYRNTLIRQISTRIRKSSACCPKGTGSRVRRP
jgi:ring-1,2-phenylacetyl-CoA epoxidase subunit PaaA